MKDRQVIAETVGVLVTTLVAVLLLWLIWLCLSKYSTWLELLQPTHPAAGMK